MIEKCTTESGITAHLIRLASGALGLDGPVKCGDILTSTSMHRDGDAHVAGRYRAGRRVPKSGLHYATTITPMRVETQPYRVYRIVAGDQPAYIEEYATLDEARRAAKERYDWDNRVSLNNPYDLWIDGGHLSGRVRWQDA